MAWVARGAIHDSGLIRLLASAEKGAIEGWINRRTPAEESAAGQPAAPRLTADAARTGPKPGTEEADDGAQESSKTGSGAGGTPKAGG